MPTRMHRNEIQVGRSISPVQRAARTDPMIDRQNDSTCSRVGGAGTDADPHDTAPVEHRPGDVALAGCVDAGRRVHRSRSSSSPATRRQSRLSGCGATISNRSSSATQPAELLGQRHIAPDPTADRVDTVETDREPQLQRPETTAERDLPVAVVDRAARLGGLRSEVLGQDAQCSEQGRPIGDPEQRAVEVDAHPLVRIGRVAVGPVEAVVDPAELGGQCGDAAHRRIDVQPDPVFDAHVGDLAGRVERQRRGRAVRAAHEERNEPVVAGRCSTAAANASGRIANCSSWSTTRIRSVPIPAMRRPFSTDECACEVVYAVSRLVSPVVLTAPAVARQRAARIATSAASLAEPWMTPPPRSLVDRKPRRQVQQLLHPVEHQGLDLGAGRRRDPAHALHAETGRQQFTEDRGVRGVRREVGEPIRDAASA